MSFQHSQGAGGTIEIEISYGQTGIWSRIEKLQTDQGSFEMPKSLVQLKSTFVRVIASDGWSTVYGEGYIEQRRARAAGARPRDRQPSRGDHDRSQAVTEVMRRASEEREHFDIWNEVPLVPQTTGMSCWAAAAAMLIGWRDCITVDPQAVANGAGRWAAYREGLEPADVPALARAWQLRDEPATRLTIAGLGELLRDRGPLWLGEASPGLHSIVVTGMFGDGSAEHTFVRINDPWPIDRGERYVQPFAELLRNFNAATAVVGEHVQLLHTGGRQRGRSSWRHSQQRRSISVSEKDGGQDRARVHWNHAAERSDRVDVVTRLNQAQQLGSGAGARAS